MTSSSLLADHDRRPSDKAQGGWIGGRTGSPLFWVGGGHGAGEAKGLAKTDSLLGETLPDHAGASIAGARRAAAVWIVLWLLPVLVLSVSLGSA